MLAKFDANNILKFSLTCYIDFKVSWQTKFQFMENTSPPEKTPTPFELSYPLKTRGGSKNLFNSLIKYLPSVYQMMQKSCSILIGYALLIVEYSTIFCRPFT